MASTVVRVAAAVIVRADGAVLLAQRPPGKVYEGYWEFPGGKLERGETPRQALDRELEEELGLEVRRACAWLVRRYAYAHADVELHFFRVFAFDGKPVGRDGQAFAWQHPGHFTVSPLLPANAPIIEALQLPPIYAVSAASEMGESIFLERLRHAMDAGLRLVVMREKSWSLERQRALTDRVLSIARSYGARVLLNGSDGHARQWGCDGVHWTSAMLANASLRPEDLLCAASCHDAAEVQRAGELSLDFVVLGPVLKTLSHPVATPLGWKAFASAIEHTSVPVFALGGLTGNDLTTAIDHGAHGVALRSAVWRP
ncbi:MAG: Nudix family hydrolase [Pseudomonadota bacterium]|nr:Nudix family hydrolase [Pseudomonadota bacterium]